MATSYKESIPQKCGGNLNEIKVEHGHSGHLKEGSRDIFFIFVSINVFVPKNFIGEPVPPVLMEESGYSYADFPVEETIELNEIADIKEAITRMTTTYVRSTNTRDFSYRLLLPR